MLVLKITKYLIFFQRFLFYLNLFFISLHRNQKFDAIFNHCKDKDFILN